LKAFIFKPSNQYIGKFSIASVDQIHDGFRKFAKLNEVKPFDYVECAKITWTVQQSEGEFILAEGRVFPSPEDLPARPQKEEELDEADGCLITIVSLGILFGGGGVVGGIFNVVSQFVERGGIGENILFCLLFPSFALPIVLTHLFRKSALKGSRFQE